MKLVSLSMLMLGSTAEVSGASFVRENCISSCDNFSFFPHLKVDCEKNCDRECGGGASGSIHFSVETCVNSCEKDQACVDSCNAKCPVTTPTPKNDPDELEEEEEKQNLGSQTPTLESNAAVSGASFDLQNCFISCNNFPHQSVKNDCLLNCERECGFAPFGFVVETCRNSCKGNQVCLDSCNAKCPTFNDLTPPPTKNPYLDENLPDFDQFKCEVGCGSGNVACVLNCKSAGKAVRLASEELRLARVCKAKDPNYKPPVNGGECDLKKCDEWDCTKWCNCYNADHDAVYELLDCAAADDDQQCEC